MHTSTETSDAGNRHLLQGVLRVGNEWVNRLSTHDPKFRPVAFLVEVTQGLLKDADFSPEAMTTARAMLCANCRRIDAVQGRCTGTSLNRCELVNAPVAST